MSISLIFVQTLPKMLSKSPGQTVRGAGASARGAVHLAVFLSLPAAVGQTLLAELSSQRGWCRVREAK